MKKIWLGIVISLFLVIPLGVNAESGITMKCDKESINSDEVLTCNLSLTGEANKIEGTLKIADSSSITFNGANGVTGSINDNKLVISSANLVENTQVGNLQIKFNSNATGTKVISLSKVSLYKDDMEVGTIDKLESSIKVTSSINTLDSLTISDCNNCKLSPSFRKNVTMYMVQTNSSQIRINAKASGNATVKGTGLKKISKNGDIFEIVVTAESGSTKIYKIKIVKETFGDASLKDLTLSKGTLSPNFSKDITNYTVNVDSDKITLTAVKSDPNSIVRGDGEKKLEYGRNEFTILVTADDGTAKSYLITVNRTDNRNQNAYLKELKIEGKDIGFEKDIIEYIYYADKKVDELEIEATAELDSSKVEIEGNKNLKEGKNTITITVNAEDGSKKIYKIVVTKGEEKKETLYLDDIKVSGYNLNFSKEKFDYVLMIKDEKQLDIIAFSEKGYSTEIIGNENLKDGSIIKIIVTDEEGNSEIYKIKVEKKSSSLTEIQKEEMNYIPIIMTSLLVILFILDVVQLVKKLRK